ncbi:MAG: holo-ACP synthase [Phycisphaerales bacterium]|jgi:holo-[acyl-carrier protein] synthase|nr:holo-ACP synthase [Phycisphaerales bacterium]
MIIVHGVDVIDVPRISSMLEKHGEHFIQRCFTKTEQDAASVSSEQTRAQRFAARYAAKEAVLKALGTGLSGGIEWIEIGVIRDEGAPRIELTGMAAEVATKAGIEQWRLSMSHSSGVAFASVIGFGG